jgi:hypothetical protein
MGWKRTSPIYLAKGFAIDIPSGAARSVALRKRAPKRPRHQNGNKILVAPSIDG